MSKLEIPESWAVARLQDVSIINMGQSPSGSDVTKNEKGFQLVGGAANLKPTGIVADQYVLKPKKLCGIGDIILCIRATIGRYAVADRAYCLGRGVAGITPSKIEPMFLCKLIESQQSYLDANATGSTFKQVDKTTIQSMPVPLPPLGEQKRIVAKIESTQAKIKTVEQSVTKAEELIGKYREALLQKAFRGELVPQDPNDEPASKLLERIRADRAKQTDGKKKKKDNLPPIKPEEIPFEIPKSWEWVRLGELSIQMDSGWSPDCKEVPASVGQWGVLKTTAVQLDQYRADANKVLPKGLTPKPEKEVVVGDILVTRAGPKNRVGIACLVKSTQQMLMISDKIVRIKLNTLVNADVLTMFLASSFARPMLEHLMTGMAESQVNISQENFRLLPVPLPPSKIQNLLATELRALQGSLPKFALQFKGIEMVIGHLKNSVLEQAFSGQLVHQDPSEGTGHELLEKINGSAQAAGGITNSRPATKANGKKKPRNKK